MRILFKLKLIGGILTSIANAIMMTIRLTRLNG